jgi:hypothetical protein
MDGWMDGRTVVVVVVVVVIVVVYLLQTANITLNWKEL